MNDVEETKLLKDLSYSFMCLIVQQFIFFSQWVMGYLGDSSADLLISSGIIHVAVFMWQSGWRLGPIGLSATAH